MTGSDPKQIARELLEEAHPALIGLSHWIHANPELGYQEVLASGWVTEWLTTAGFEVRTGVGGMPTAIVGSYGPGPFHVAVCVEYDALPAVGHACGHNVIAAAGVGAGLALAAVADELGMRVTVLGTPAEETGGGKVGLIKAGELDGVHAAMMVHPWPQDEVEPTIIAIRSLEVSYTGREAHAAGFPYLGVNAADALVVAQTAIALLRQQLTMTDRVHGIVTKGGDAANIIPARTTATWMVRGRDVARLDEVTEKVRRCFEAGALATGCTLEIVEEICYADVRHDRDLARLYRANGEALGRVFSEPGMPVSTDMGNMSYTVPTIHPMIGIEAGGAVNHQADFAAACATPSADQAIFDGALAMAWTAIDAAQDAQVRERLMSFRADPAEVELVSARWLMPPLAVAAAASDPVAEAPADAGSSAGGDAMALEDQLADLADLFDGPMAGQVVTMEAEVDPVAQAEPMAEPDPIAEPEPIAEPDPVAEVSGLADWAAMTAAEQPAWPAHGAEPAAESPVEAPVEPAATAALEAAPAESAQAAGAEAELDPDAAWAADVHAIEEQIRAATLAAPAVDPAPAPAPALAPLPTAAAVPQADGPTLGAEPRLDESADVLFIGFDDPVASAEDVPATQPAAVLPTEVAPVPTVEELRDRDAWDRAFEAMLSRPVADGPSPGTATLADAPAPSTATTATSLPQGWAPSSGEAPVSRERIEAEGFSFVAPEVTSHDDASDAWYANGTGQHEDLRLR